MTQRKQTKRCFSPEFKLEAIEHRRLNINSALLMLSNPVSCTNGYVSIMWKYMASRLPGKQPKLSDKPQRAVPDT
jgi:hypothetical protein